MFGQGQLLDSFRYKGITVGLSRIIRYNGFVDYLIHDSNGKEIEHIRFFPSGEQESNKPHKVLDELLRI